MSQAVAPPRVAEVAVLLLLRGCRGWWCSLSLLREVRAIALMAGGLPRVTFAPLSAVCVVGGYRVRCVAGASLTQDGWGGGKASRREAARNLGAVLSSDWQSADTFRRILVDHMINLHDTWYLVRAWFVPGASIQHPIAVWPMCLGTLCTFTAD